MANAAFDMKRLDAYAADPDTELAIVTHEPRDDAGIHDRVDPAHVLCERNERPFTEEEVDFADANGIITPISVVKDGKDLGIVHMGRRRTRLARAVNAKRREKNKSLPADQQLPMLLVKFIPIRATDVVLRGMMIAENMQRSNYSPVQVANGINDFRAMGASDEQVAKAFGVKRSAIGSYLGVLDTSPTVQAAVASGSLSVTAAAALADLPRKEQDKALAELPAGKKMTVRTAQRAAKAATPGADTTEPPSKKEIREMFAALERIGPVTMGDLIARDVLSWVLTGKRTDWMPAKETP